MARIEPSAARYYADVPNRLAALLVDAVLLTVAIFMAAVVVSVLIGPAVELDSSADSLGDAVSVDRGIATVDALLSLAISAAYFAGSWVRFGATPGQRLIGLRLGAEGDGVTLAPGRALARWALLGGPFAAAALITTIASGLSHTIPDLVVAAWYLVLLVSTARSPTKQGLHDRLARSVVAKQATPLSWERSHADVH